MSSDSSSSRGSSPTRFRPQSPASDAGGVAPSSWQPSAFHPSSSFNPSQSLPSATTFHPSASLQASQSSATPVLRQPVGFGTSPPSIPTYHAPPSESSSAVQHYLPGQIPPTEEASSKSRKKATKGKEKDAPKEKSKGSSRKGKEIDQGTTGQTAPSQASGGYPGQRTAFRVKSYSNDPTAVGSPYTIQDGPYGAAYRADLGDRPKPGGAKSSKKKARAAAPQSQPDPPAPTPTVQPPPSQYQYPPVQPPTSSHPYPPQPQPAHGTQEAEPRNSYYRYDYDKLRQSAPGFHPDASATPAPQSSAPPPPPPQPQPQPPPQPQPQYHHYSSPAPPPPPPTQDYYGQSSRSSKRKDTHMYSHGYQHQYPPPEHHHYHRPSPSPPPSPPRNNYESMHPQHSWPPPAPPPAHTYAASYPPTYPPPLPPPSHSEKRHKSKSRSHRHEQTHYYPPAPPPPSVPPIPEAPPPAVRVCRVLTLLIEDKRNPDGECMLAEVRVPLKPAGTGDDGFWADAQDVSEELQKGPSRIDGSAKVYTQRGKYKQYFLRIPANGEPVCQPANLRVAPDRTIEIVIEDNLPAGGKPVEAHVTSSPPRLQRELLTPVTDSRTSPSPAPMHSPPKRSSLFSMEDTRSPREDRFDTVAYSVPRASTASEASRKRPRSSSMQSVQSVRSAYSENYSVPSQHHDSISPLPHRSSSVRTSSASISRAPSRASPPPPSEPAPMSPVSPPSDPPTPPRSYRMQASSKAAQTPTFSQTQPTPSAQTSTPSAFMANSPPAKKAKLTALQATPRDDKSMSPGPNQSAARPWSSSRTPSLTDSSSPQIAGKGPRISSTSSSSSTAPASSRFSNPFARYESGYGLASRQTGAHDNASSPSIGITLPSIPSLSTVSNPTPPTTLAPSATALAPSLSGVATSALDTAVGLWIRGVISKESQWDAFVKNRARVLRMREQLEQYKYVQRVIDRYVGTTTPVDLEGAGGVTITKAQVMRAFNLSLAWGEDCTETLVMTTLYGPGGTRCEDARVCAMMEEEPPISTGIQAKKYLALLREVHGQWTVAHPDGL